MLDNLQIPNPELARDAVAGLSRTPKSMSPKWFYDETGSALFEEITTLPEYYPTRTETAILRQKSELMHQYVSDETVLVELGSGASVKTRILLDTLKSLQSYVPLDISAEFLSASARDLARQCSTLPVRPVVADFMTAINLPDDLAERPKLLFFPGSTLGNLTPEEAHALLSRLAGMQPVSALVLGVDLVKDRQTLVNAYDDQAGVTAAFNKNLLKRLNTEALADFDLEAFAHEARWNEQMSRIEMHLVATRRQTIRIGMRDFTFAKGESLHTENSHKFTRAAIEQLAMATGWGVDAFWTDEKSHFAVSVLVPQ